MAGFVVTVGDRISSTVLRAYDSDDGSALWTADHPATVYCVAIDVNGNVYTGGAQAGTPLRTTRKYSQDGTLLWSKNHISIVRGIAVDSNGYVYTVGSSYATITIRKYDNDGNEITTDWPKSYAGGRTLNAICIDDDDNIYVTGSVYSDSGTNKTTHKYNSSGVEQWYINRGATTYAINITGDYVTVGGDSDGTYTSASYNLSDGSLVTGSEKNHGATVNGIARNSTADLCGNLSSGVTTRIASATLNHGGTVNCICVDVDGYVYTGGNVASSVTTRKYTSAGVEITTGDWPLNHTDDVRGIACWPTVLFNINPPGLLLNVSLAAPFLTYTNGTPALLLDLSLGIPTFSGISQPPDIYAIDYPNQIIYKLYVSGTTLVELPFSSFQCRRSLGQSTFLTVVIPNYSTTLVDLLEARKTANNNLIIYSGYVDSNDQETLGEFIKSTIIDIRVERNSSSGTITVYGRVIPVSFTTQSRTLHQISKRGKTESGKKTATCAVDFNLRPNDTAIDGLSSWTVGDITLFVGNGTSYMIVTEN